MPHPLIDIGANLTHDSFRDDLDDVLARAAAAGVGRMLVTGSDDQGNIDAAELAEAYPGPPVRHGRRASRTMRQTTRMPVTSSSAPC